MPALDNMRGPRLETPVLFLLLLLSSQTGTASEEDGTGDEVTEGQDAEVTVDDASPTITSDPPGTDEESSLPTTLDPSASDYPLETGPTDQINIEEGPDLLLILIPAVLAVVIIGAIVGVVIIMRCRKDNAQNQEPSKEDLDLEGSSTEKVPMPMFEDDVPSVLELEMEELDQLMQKDG
ncbi:transmembrane protein 154-like isoform X2 [Fundulus heteroclitus]|uniref:transmembrane protein 154-like isoform X2 n=1 Tax=Fundulus heteroclitus TaxID=8078 RepID=UPI00165BD58C|nr:transmembrane protein 154-like isoform X2 [Fundulus heteroclitus]